MKTKLQQILEQLEQIHSLTDSSLTNYEMNTLTIESAIEYITEIDNIAFSIEETLNTL